jgi:transcriptional regulator with XRE-family HTH domain
MSKLKTVREQNNLTQEELSEKSKISVRTIQRIEAGTEPKGHTLKALAKALDLEESALQDHFAFQDNSEEATLELQNVDQKEEKEQKEEINYFRIKMINLSSLLFVILPPFNILVPLFLMLRMKERNALARQIISVQMMWTAMAPIVFILGIFLKIGKQFTLILMIIIVLSNVLIILRNAAEIDRRKKLYFSLKFNMI